MVLRFPPDGKFFPHLREQVGWPRVTLSFLRYKCAMVWDDTRLTPNKIPLLGPYVFPDASEALLPTYLRFGGSRAPAPPLHS